MKDRQRSDKIRVLIADDHAVLVEGLALYLSSSAQIEVVGTTVSGRRALELTRELEPDVLLLDVMIPDLNGLEVLSILRAEGVSTRVIILTSYRNVEYLSQAIALGAAGFLSKEVGLSKIPQAIRATLDGEAIVDKDLLRKALEESNKQLPDTRSAATTYESDLTERESRVLELLADGLTNDDIAERLSISRNTVKTHVSRVYEKLGVSDRTQAAIWAIRKHSANA